MSKPPVRRRTTPSSKKTTRTRAKKVKKSRLNNLKDFYVNHKKGISLTLKVSVTLLCALGLYGVYLDGKIRHRMDGPLWQLPAEVYAKIPDISLKNQISVQDVLRILKDNGYQQTKMIANPGDYQWQDGNLLLLTRAFAFPNDVEPQRLLRLHFSQDQLVRIEDLNKYQLLDHFSLAPKLIAMLQSDKEDRLALSLNHFPRLLIDTLIMTEDRDFFEHDGINPMSIARAAIANLRAGHSVQGGSTLTQQVVKNLFLTNKRSFVRKFNEAYMALLLDYRYSKNRILETYLNEVYLGQMGDTQIHGFALASLFYFNRPINEISLDKIALLVGMVKGPSLYNPWRHPENALKRRNVVLGILRDQKVIDNSLYELLSRRPLGVQEKGQIAQSFPAFIQLLRRELQANLGANVNELSGTRIFTTLDVNQQKAAEAALTQQLQNVNKRRRVPLEGAIVIADYKTGGIRALIGGANTEFAGFNRAVDSRRQIGSLVKPSVYLTALSEPTRFALNTKLDNQPISIKQANGTYWQPRNYDRQYSAPVTLINALTHSMNIPTVNLGLEVGLKKIIATQKAMGWENADIPQVPSALLGVYSLSPYEVTRLYQTLANEGKKIPLHVFTDITNRKGDVLYHNNIQAEQVVPPQASFLTLFAMQNVVKNGTARSLQSQFSNLNLAGKTGTTNRSRDAWFVGIDGQDVTTIWVGRDNNDPTNLTGATGALPIYKQYLNRYPVTPLQLAQPADIDWAGINYNGDWQCDLPYKIPYWKTDNSSVCDATKKSITRSIWDFLWGK